MAKDETHSNLVTIICGSARAAGNASSLSHYLKSKMDRPVQLCDLSQLILEPFAYDRHEDRDDFRLVVANMLESSDIVFVTPVYWYAMSGSLKMFFDRLTDLLHDPDDRISGRQLAGRNVWLLATGTDEDLPAGFEVPFERTADYFAMKWREAYYSRSSGEVGLAGLDVALVDQLAGRLNAASASYSASSIG